MTNDNKKPPRVFLTQETNLNLSKAHVFGEIIALLPTDRNITLSPQPVLRELKRKLDDFTDNDYLLLIGDPLAVALAVFAAAEVNVGRFKMLKWDRKLLDYYVVSVDLFDRMKKMEG